MSCQSCPGPDNHCVRCVAVELLVECTCVKSLQFGLEDGVLHAASLSLGFCLVYPSEGCEIDRCSSQLPTVLADIECTRQCSQPPVQQETNINVVCSNHPPQWSTRKLSTASYIQESLEMLLGQTHPAVHSTSAANFQTAANRPLGIT